LDNSPTVSTDENYTIIDGIIYQGDYLTVMKGNSIPLGNNPENEKTGVLLEFLLFKEGSIIFKSPKLKAGTGVNFVPSDYLDEGIHNIHIVINVYHENGAQDAGYEQDIKINVVE
jgi:hypothetical protein